MRHAGSIWINVLFILSIFLAAPAVADETRLIQLRNRSAAEMLPLIQPLLGPADAISGTDYRLIVRTSDKNFKEIEKLIAQLDTAKRQFRIQVKQDGVETRSNSGAGVSGEYKTGNTRVQLPNQSPRNNDVTIRRNGVEIQTSQTRTTSSNSSAQFITALDGTPAFIRVGQSYPQVQRILALTGKQQVLLAQGVSFNNVVSGFEVTPRAQGDNVLLQITPRLATMSNPATGIINFQEYSTTVVAKPGEWIDLGGLNGSGSEVRRAILDVNNSESGEQRTILIKVD